MSTLRPALEIEREVQRLYEAHPYPNWKDKLDPAELRKHTRMLGLLGIPEAAWQDAVVLDAGCGTGEKTMVLTTHAPRLVVGVDRAQAPIRNAAAWARDHGVDNVAFVRGTVLDLAFLPDASIDIVHSTGVLHHTPDPARGFRELARVLRPGGHLVVYVYNPYGRAYVLLKRALVTALAGRKFEARARWAQRLFGMWREEGRDSAAVYHDFYSHPHESAHSIGEVLRWVAASGLVFHGAYPGIGWRQFWHSWAVLGRPGLLKRLAGRGGRGPHGPAAHPGVVARGLAQSAGLAYAMIGRTNIGWVIAARKPAEGSAAGSHPER